MTHPGNGNPPAAMAQPCARLLAGALLATSVGFAAACGASTQDAPPARDDEAVRAAREQAFQRKDIAKVPPPQDVGVTEPVPASLLNNAREHLARRSQYPPDQIEVVSSEQQVWPDGSMGCPQPGLNYTHEPVRGYRIILRAGSREYDYRIAASGYLVLCEGMWLENPPLS